mmetsp:Transcript_34489/g.75314  ORF Transcript_34489/g.75314 Transcript_34489/m.75314 type:complete len:199 (-) Transcript_34489:55-651(-)
MGNAAIKAVSAASGCANCECENGKRANELCFQTIEAGAYPHQAYHEDDTWSSPDVFQAQNVVKNFVRVLVKGLPLQMLVVNGGTAECVAYLDRDLTSLSLERAGARRPIWLKDVSEVVVGCDGGKDYGFVTDTLSVTLVLTSGQGLGFSFESEEERDTFALCLSMFVDGQRQQYQESQAIEIQMASRPPASVAAARKV